MKPGCALLIVLLLAIPSGTMATAQSRLGEQSRATPTRDTATDTRPRRVLALYSEASDHPVNVSFIREFHAVLKEQSGNTVEHYVEYYEAARFPGEEQARIMCDYLRQKYADRKIDVLFPWGPFNLEFVLKYRAELFPDTPIVYYSGTLDEVRDYPLPPMTGVLNPDTYERTLDLILDLHRDTKEVFVISGTPERDRSIEHDIAVQLEEFQSRVKFTYLTDLRLEQLLTTVKGLPRGAIILYSRQQQDEAGRVLQQSDYIDVISRTASVPLYAPWHSSIGYGSVGGVVDDREAGARKAAEIVVRVARGARPEDVPPERTPRIATFDARQLKRWGISEDRLPAGSVVLFRDSTIWARYRNYIVGTGVLLGVQTMLIAGLLVGRARRRRVEQALRESEERFRLMADTAPVMVWRSNAAKEFDYLNLPWLKFRGRSLEQEAGSGWTKGIHPDDRERVLTAYSAAFDERRAVQMEYRLQHADGEYRWVMSSGVPRFGPDNTFAGYIGSCFDITQRRLAEAALQESERRYALATAAGSVGVWDWNLETGEMYVDPVLKRVLGFADDEIENRFESWSQHVHPEDAGRLRHEAHAHIDGGTPFFEIERRMLHRDGSVRWFLTRGSAVRQSHKDVTRVTGTDTDITQRRHAEARLEDARREYTRIARVTTLAQFAASIAHEVSQPLGAILMNSRACLSWLGGSGVPTDELRSALQDIVEDANRAKQVINRDRELFRHRPAAKQVVEIKRIIADVAALARTRLEQSSVRLTVRVEDALPPVVGDQVELQQVLLNLFLNGIEAMESVDIRSRRLTVDARVTADDLVQVTVHDTGTGLRNVDVDRLFTPFYTTKPAGTGVGLSLSRSIVEAHGGQLWAESDNGSGATFRFTLPLADDLAILEAGDAPVLEESEGDRVH